MTGLEATIKRNADEFELGIEDGKHKVRIVSLVSQQACYLGHRMVWEIECQSTIKLVKGNFLMGSECSKDLEACAEAKREKAQVRASKYQVKLGENAPKRGHAEPKRYRVGGTMLIKEMEIYALGSLVDSGWMLLDGWRHRARKRGNARACVYIAKRGNGARMARIARESCASYRNCCRQYTEWCCKLVLYTP
ncbi:hypothetical protein EV424DRAFT_1352520 [Suillus variegatus]|nr:hypothetical protein EV424DRAFT_1352520 [Suillus variegatus]